LTKRYEKPKFNKKPLASIGDDAGCKVLLVVGDDLSILQQTLNSRGAGNGLLRTLPVFCVNRSPKLPRGRKPKLMQLAAGHSSGPPC